MTTSRQSVVVDKSFLQGSSGAHIRELAADRRLLMSDSLFYVVEVGRVGDVPLDGGTVATERPRRALKHVRAAAHDEDERPFSRQRLRARQADSRPAPRWHTSIKRSACRAARSNP